MDELLNLIFSSQPRVILIVATLLLILAELGFQRGLALHKAGDEARKSQVSTLQSSILGLLALLLGFTFAMAMQRYDHRRDLVVKEANAIGTTYLRASFLPEPHQTDIEDLLRNYVDVRLAFYEAGSDASKIATQQKTAAEIQRQLWNHTITVGRESNSPLTASFVTSLNETIDLDSTRYEAMRNRIPASVWLLLLIVSGCACWSTGYTAGANGKRIALAQTIVPLLIAVVITIVVDFATPRRGLITISQESMIKLKQSLVASQGTIRADR